MAKSDQLYDGMKDPKFSISLPWAASVPPTSKPLPRTDDDVLDEAPVVYCSSWTPPSQDI